MNNFEYRRLVQASREWFSEPCKQGMWVVPRNELTEMVSHPSPLNCGKMIGRISKLAAWHARRGCILMNEEGIPAWQEIRKHLDYELWILRAQIDRVQILSGRGAPDADPTWKPSHLLGMALAFRDWVDAGWLGKVMHQSRNTKLLGDKWGSARRDPFACYVFELWTRNTGRQGFPDTFGPYAGIFTLWDQPANLADGIRSACDYHVERIDTGNPTETGEFENNPHDIFPSEILALYRVREKLGLETPWVKHPLLDTPFTQVPEQITYEPDPLVVQAMDLVTKLLPEALAKR